MLCGNNWIRPPAVAAARARLAANDWPPPLELADALLSGRPGRSSTPADYSRWMDVSVTSRRVELTEALRETAVEKIGRLSRFVDGMERAEVRFLEDKGERVPHKKSLCEVTLTGHGHHVRVKVAAADPFAALDVAVKKLEQQLHKLKTRVLSRSRPRPGRPAPDKATAIDEGVSDHAEEAEPALDAVDDGDAGGDVAADADGTHTYRIVRSKQFVMEPMTPEDAVLHLDLLGHDFFFFSNADTGKAAVVYRRTSGDIGLIDEAG